MPEALAKFRQPFPQPSTSFGESVGLMPCTCAGNQRGYRPRPAIVLCQSEVLGLPECSTTLRVVFFATRIAAPLCQHPYASIPILCCDRAIGYLCNNSALKGPEPCARDWNGLAQVPDRERPSG